MIKRYAWKGSEVQGDKNVATTTSHNMQPNSKHMTFAIPGLVPDGFSSIFAKLYEAAGVWIWNC